MEGQVWWPLEGVSANMRIGQLAEATGTTTKTLRFYEESGLLPPAERLASGYRDYAEDAVGRVGFIHRGQAAGLTLAQIRQILDIRDGGQAPCKHVRDLLDVRLAEIEQQIADLRQDAAHPDPETCSTDQVCRYL